jgi:drug/metabolite transporter (DMT)-like permease
MLLWASNYAVIGKVHEVMPELPASEFTALRFLIAGSMFVPTVYEFLFGSGERLGLEDSRARLEVLGRSVAAGACVFLGYFGQAIGLQHSTASKASFLCSLQVVVVTLGAVLISAAASAATRGRDGSCQSSEEVRIYAEGGDGKLPPIYTSARASTKASASARANVQNKANASHHSGPALSVPQAAACALAVVGAALRELPIPGSAAAAAVAAGGGGVDAGLGGTGWLGISNADLWLLLQPLGFGGSYLLAEGVVKERPQLSAHVSALQVVTASALLSVWAAIEALSSGMSSGTMTSASGIVESVRENVHALSAHPQVITALLYTGLVTTGAAIFAQGAAFRRVEAGEASFILSAEPVAAAVFGAAAGSGPGPAGPELCGAVLMVAASVVGGMMGSDYDSRQEADSDAKS